MAVPYMISPYLLLDRSYLDRLFFVTFVCLLSVSHIAYEVHFGFLYAQGLACILAYSWHLTHSSNEWVNKRCSKWQNFSINTKVHSLNVYKCPFNSDFYFTSKAVFNVFMALWSVNQESWIVLPGIACHLRLIIYLLCYKPWLSHYN